MSLLQFRYLKPNICSSSGISNSRPSAPNNFCERSNSSWCCSFVNNNRDRGGGGGAFFPSSVPPPSTSSSRRRRRRRRLLCPPAQGKHVREDYLVKKLSGEEVEQLVRGERKVPIVIDFYATWCGPCILMAQELEMLAVEYESNAMIVKVDTDNEYEFARDMQVRGLPTLYFISAYPNKEAIRTEGLIPLEMMRDIIDNEM